MRTMHTFNDLAGGGGFGKMLLCICPESGDDDPNCPALLEYDKQHFAAEDAENKKLLDLLDAPRNAVDLAMEKIRTAQPGENKADIDEALKVINDSRIAEGRDPRNSREVAIGQNPFVQKKEALVKEMVSSKYSMRRRGRMIPERGRMVVARVEWDEKLGSIFILDNHVKQLTESNQEVVILACGPLRIDPVTGKEVPMRFSIEDVIGRHCVIREHSGIEFITYDENGKMMICYWIGQSEIWGWLEPYPGDEVNSEEIWKAIAYLGEETAPAAEGPFPPPLCTSPCSFCPRPCDSVHELGQIQHFCSDCVPGVL